MYYEYYSRRIWFEVSSYWRDWAFGLHLDALMLNVSLVFIRFGVFITPWYDDEEPHPYGYGP